MNGLSIILLILVIAGICTWGIAGIFIVLGLAWLIAFIMDNINNRVDAAAKAREEEAGLKAEAEYTVKKAFYDMRVSQYKRDCEAVKRTGRKGNCQGSRHRHAGVLGRISALIY